MNIRDAKTEIVNTVAAYLSKDETGGYEIPVERQRPILLMGPPGIGKTAIMEQAAAELGINLVSYTITHHTRQSAIGLPFISRREYDGQTCSVTEYTMSEIIASVYDQIERSGIREGILFLDEINCVSETLAPTMLQFLQYKTFGTHKVPEGFVIVTAGNPPAYNKSVRDLDIVTLDRVKRIDIDVDYEAWKDYAYRTGIHGSILSYLEIQREHFYRVETGVDGKRFVTARGWEDLSRILKVYEKLQYEVTERLVVQYLQMPSVAADFAAYYDMYNRYRNVYRIEEILQGTLPSLAEDFRGAAFDERLSLIGLLIDRLNRDFRAYSEAQAVQRRLYGDLKEWLAGEEPRVESLRRMAETRLEEASASRIAGSEELHSMRKELLAIKELEVFVGEQYQEQAEQKGTHQTDQTRSARDWFGMREAERVAEAGRTGEHLTNAFAFLEKTFGEGQELVIFLTELSGGYHSLKYVSECGNEAYYRYNKLLLLHDRQESLRKEVTQLMEL